VKSVVLHKPVKKVERLLTLYYIVYKESAEDVFYYEKRNNYIIENELKVSRLTGERYVNILIETGRVYIDDEDDWGKCLKNNIFVSIDEVCDFIQNKEKEWIEKGSLTPEKKSLLYLIRLCGWMDLFNTHGKISEMDISKHYSDLTKKRKLLRDFKILRELESIHLNIRRKYIVVENDEKQWFYVVEK
jgi:hypothetical protein